MTARIPSSPAAVAGAFRDLTFRPHVEPPKVTSGIIDQAVDSVFREHSVEPHTAAVLKRLMSTDPDAAVARSYYQGKIGEGLRGSLRATQRREISIPYVLDEKQVSLLTRYAPEYNFRFDASMMHDHPQAAASRKIDRQLLVGRVPAWIPYTDVGGAPEVHMDTGELGTHVHCCSPIVDAKDPGRAVYVRLRAQRIASDVRRSEECRSAAVAYLSKASNAVCDLRAQDCEWRSKVLISCHVYDIPLSDWPKIMHKKGATLVEGCILFPTDLFALSAGSMTTAGARYEIDVAADTFRMGFLGSYSWWYSHKFSEYVRYGVDQVFHTDHGSYSYKVVERRGDTLFFRILPVAQTAATEYRQTYRVPGVDMVSVRGFHLDGPNIKQWRRKEWLFPRPLWEDMLIRAKEMIERGALSHERLFNYYRTVAPRQTINGILVAGGFSVDEHSQLVPLVVHVILVAATEVLKSRAESAYIIDSELARRSREEEWALYKVLAAFGDSLVAVLKVPFLPLKMLDSYVSKGMEALSMCRLVDWRVEASVKVISLKLLMPSVFPDAMQGESGFVTEMSDDLELVPYKAARHEPELARMVAAEYRGLLPDEFVAQLDDVVRAKDVALERSDEVVTTPVVNVETARVAASGDTTIVATSAIGPSMLGIDVTRLTREGRNLAIREAIEETLLEARKVEAACSLRYLTLMAGGKPSLALMSKYAEEYNNPDLWWVQNGIMQKSFLGSKVENLEHSAAFVPVAPNGQRLTKLQSEQFEGFSEGEWVIREYMSIGFPDYTGWVYVDDNLIIYNGPEIVSALEEALGLDGDFRVILHQGPPGCGKTYAIEHMGCPEDMFLVPGKLAAQELSVRLARTGGSKMEKVVRDRVRTVDSYLCNRRKKRVKSLRAARLIADECFMTRAGRWYAAALLLGATEIHAYGDVKQIPHVPRAECPQDFLRIRPTEVDFNWVTYRCPAELVACWGDMFEWRVRSKSSVVGSVRHVAPGSMGPVPEGACLMDMYRAGKKALIEKYKSTSMSLQIITTHESEGKTYTDVILFRHDYRVRPAGDRTMLYDLLPYVLVAMSRCTRSFTYVAPRLGDEVQRRIEMGKDPRRIAAARDVASAGESIEFL